MKRKAWIYILFLIVCLAITGYRLSQATEVVSSGRYGLSTDGTIPLDKESKISMEMDLTSDYFKGISVKFQASGTFSEEIIHASLVDCDTEEVLSECEIPLKYERIQNKDGGSAIFFPLSLENASGLTVRIEFVLSGEEIQTIPEFVVSNSKLLDSKLVYNDEAVDSSLVATVQYVAGEDHDYVKKIVTCIIWILFGSILFFWDHPKSIKKDTVHNTSSEAIQNRSAGDEIINDTAADYHGSRAVSKSKFLLTLGIMLIILLISMLHTYLYPVKYVATGDYSQVRGLFSVICLVIITAASLIFFLLFAKNIRAESAFALIALTAGILFCIVITVDSVPDEPSHIDTAYSISNEMLGIEATSRSGYIYKRVCDLDSDAEEKQYITIDSYQQLCGKLFQTASEEEKELVETAARSNLNNAGKIYYIPQAVGISIGRVLGLGYMPTIMLGRLCALLVYIVLTYFAIKTIPIGKISLLLIACLPISLQQAASISYDSMINAAAFLYIASCLNMLYGKKKTGRMNAAVLLITGCMTVTVKGGVYVLLGFLPLFGLLRKTVRECTGIKKLVYPTGVFLLAFVNANLLSSIIRFSAVQGSVVGGAASSEIFTLSYFIKDPMHFFSIFVNTLYLQTDGLVRNMVGGNLGWREINLKWYLVFAFLLMLLVSCLSEKTESTIKRKERICLLTVGAGSFLLVVISMLFVWTPVTSTYIRGVQGRYFIPFLILILLGARNNLFKVARNIDRQLVFGIAFFDFIAVLQVIQIVCTKAVS